MPPGQRTTKRSHMTSLTQRQLNAIEDRRERQAKVAGYIANTVTWDSMLHRLQDGKSAREVLVRLHFGPNRAHRRAVKRSDR